jgi:putative salt-induced outer membrane protein
MDTRPILALALAVAAAPAALAADLPALGNVHAGLSVARPAIIPDGGWFTSAELGAISTSGNTTGTSVSGKIDARQELPHWSNEYVLSGFFKQDEVMDEEGNRHRQTSAERYAMSAKTALKLLGEGKRAFALATHVNDKFGAYTRYTTFAIGHGSQWYNTDHKTLDVEIGPGYFNGKREDGESESGVTVRGAARFRWEMSESALFAQTVSVERGTSNMRSVAETSLSTRINSTMQMKAAFSARNDTNVPPEKKNTDTQTSLTLVYSF